MAVRFDADGEDYSQVTSFDNSNCSGCAWVRIDVDRNAFSTLVDFSSSGVDAFGLQTDVDGVTWQIYSSSNGTSNLFAATVGTWYFIAFAKGPNNGETVAYWAAANAASLSTSGALNHNQATSISTLTYGESGFGGEWLNGTLAAVKIWAGVRLTQAEFERERFQYLPRRTQNLHAFYPFVNGGAVAAARQDFSGNGNNLSGGTSTATTDGPPIAWSQPQRQMVAPIQEAETLKGTDILDFGAFPGKSDASVNITGQTGIVSGSLVEAWIRPAATADHTADEHMVETLHVFAGNIVAGTGFTIYGINTSELEEPPPVRNEAFRDSMREPINDRKGTRIYGQWTVAWAWA